MTRSPGSPSRVVFCCGALSAEDRLLGGVLDAAAENSDLTRPVRIIVPSKSLRQHLLCRLVERGGAMAAVVVQTAFSAAREVLDRAEAEFPEGDAFFDLVVRRLANGETTLATSLESLEDGFGSVVGVVRDLLDAGFLPAHEEGVLERLDDLERPVASNRLRRARAVVRVAARSYEAMEITGAWRAASVYEHAEPLVRGDAARVLPSAAVFVHGFADVTGLVADFLSAVARAFPTTIVMDRPSRPGASGRREPGLGFLERFEARFSDLDRVEEQGPPSPAEIVLSECGDVESEARWVSERARALIDDGLAAEKIAIVARHFESLAVPLRRHLGRLGVPYSGVGEVVTGGGLRREMSRFVEVVRAGVATPVDLWLESCGLNERHLEFQLALRQIGVVRLDDVASLRLEAWGDRGVRISLDLAGVSGDSPGGTGRVPPNMIRQARDHAARLVAALDEWPESANPPQHASRTLGVADALGWNPAEPARRTVAGHAGALAAELRTIEKVERHEWLRLLADRLAGIGDEAIGGRGGGVQVLSVMEARARTFEHLFVVGFNRGIFPRLSGDDALLPDAIRSRLALDVLPEMPVRARSADEERYLFAQLFSAARSIEVSWHLASQGAVGSRSPFVADLLRSDAPNPVAPQVWSTARADLGPRPAWEHAVLVAGNAPRAKIAGPLENALATGGLARNPQAATELARSRVDILHHTDPERRDDGANPWFGFVGPVDSGDGEGPSVTLIEGTAQCPWSSFITRRLGVAPMPDPQLGLPDPRGRLVGDVVHRVLEDIVLSATGGPRENLMDEVGSRSPHDIPWPNSSRFDAILERASRDVAEAAGLGPLGMAVLLAARARPFLEVARRFEWGDMGVLGSVLATEVRGCIEIEGAGEVLRFRADRVDRREEGLSLVDYKTSKPVSCAQGDDTRRKHLLEQVRTGRKLQAPAYALVSTDRSARGRYLWLRPNIGGADETCRNGEIRGDDEDYASALRDAVVAVNGARDLGAMFPRVEEPGSDKKPDHCRYCPVAEVCRRDDSGFRRRLVEWMEAADPASSPSETAARRLWFLGTSEGGAP